MGFCNVTDCGDLESPGDPDVAGIGVVASFGLTALINLGVIIWAYLGRYLPAERYKPVDRTLLAALGQAPPALPKSADEAKALRHNIESYEKFIIALSDQQLLTGLAILIALYSKTCSISVFTFEIGISVAYFSCSIHISTLTVLRKYLQHYSKLAKVRVALMMSLAFLLLAGLLLVQSGSFYTMPNRRLACVLHNFDAIVAVKASWVQVGNTVMICWFVISAYGCFLVELFDPEFPHVIGNWYFWLALALGKNWNKRAGLAADVLTKRREITYKFNDRRKVTSVKGFVVLFPFILEEFSRSFLYKILWMLFYFTFGVTMFAQLWVQNGYYKHVLDAWGFGQLVPMFLLALPVLNAYEVHVENKDQDSKKKKHPPVAETTGPHDASGQQEAKEPQTHSVQLEVTPHDAKEPEAHSRPVTPPKDLSPAQDDLKVKRENQSVYCHVEDITRGKPAGLPTSNNATPPRDSRVNRKIATLVLVMFTVGFLCLQFYAVLLGGIFNVTQVTRPHNYVEKVSLICGYVLAGVQPALHIFRGLRFRFSKTSMWPPSWILRGI